VVVVGEPLYDNAVKDLCSRFPEVICRWLGIPVPDGVRVVNHSESLPAATRHVDALLLVVDKEALHVEFQAGGESRFACRMMEYKARLLRRKDLVGRVVHQYVVVLGQGTVEDGYQDEQMSYRYPVVYLRDQPVGPLLADAVLAPLAVLAAVPDADRPAILRQALDLIAGVTDDELLRALARAASDLANLYLDPATIDRTWEESAMPIPSLTHQRYLEGLAEGRYATIAALLRRRFGAGPGTDEVAAVLATLDADEALARVDEAESLDDLASG
jgi:hypothetical protein